MLIQNTGLGNLVTELYTIQKLYQAALPIFVSWRGYYQEPIEAQIIFGSKVEALLNAIEPYRGDIVVAVECMFVWYWLADVYSWYQLRSIPGVGKILAKWFK